MDIFTQGIAGAVAAQAASRKPHGRTATLIGLLAGLLPDADILINSVEDPLLRLEYHRQFSHALVFIPVGALLITLVMWPIVRRRLDFQHIYIYSLLGISMGGLLDACTSFGTHLLWPFSDTRTAWNLIAVVDPLFTLFLIVPLVLGWRSRKRRYPLLAVALALTYLLFGYSQNQTVGHAQQALAKGRGHQATMAIVKPTIGNILLWRSIYRHDDQYFVDAIHANPFGDIRIYPGQSIAAFPSTNVDALPETYAPYWEDISLDYVVFSP